MISYALEHNDKFNIYANRCHSLVEEVYVMKKIIGILIFIIIYLPLLSTVVLADPILDVQINGGFAINAKITNIGSETLKQTDFIRCKFTSKYFEQSMPPGFAGNRVDDLAPGQSLTFRWIPYILRFPAPGINICTIDVVIYENGNDNTIYGEKIVDCLRLGPFIILLQM